MLIDNDWEKRRVIITQGVDDTWSADLIEMKKLSKWNKGFKYVMTIIDVFPKYAWAIPLKNKYGLTAAKAFESLIKRS